MRQPQAPRCRPSAWHWTVPLVCGLSLLATSAWSASVNIGAGLRVDVPVRSLKDLRDANLVRQAYDYSCGAAALATLLTYGLEDPVTEQDILLLVLASLAKDEQALRKKQGLSLLDLQRVVQARGHKAQGFRLAPAFLSKLRRPVIVFIKPRGYEHFAVFRGLRGNRVYLADPSLGNVRMSITKFLNMWLDGTGKGIIFVAERKDGSWTENYPLRLPEPGLPRPELLTARQMLEVSNPYVRFPRLSR